MSLSISDKGSSKPAVFVYDASPIKKVIRQALKTPRDIHLFHLQVVVLRDVNCTPVHLSFLTRDGSRSLRFGLREASSVYKPDGGVCGAR